MKTLRLILLGCLFAFSTAGLMPSTARADDDGPSFDYFYDQLQDEGQWLQVDGLGNGYVWQPTQAQDPNWQPYTDGYWAFTDAGWTWVSYEDFGWITYHYGRWTQLDDVGWVWVPDYEWAPAWVSWRQSNADGPDEDANFIGWAPLPPDCVFRHGIGISFWVDANYDIGPGCYSFCRMRDFGSPVLGGVIIDRSRNVTIIGATTNITNITTSNNIVYNGGPNFRLLSKHADPAHPIQALQLVRDTDASHFAPGGAGAGKVHFQAKGNQLLAPAPLIVAPKQPFKPAKVAKVVASPKIDKGWSKVDPNQKLQLQTAIKAQTKGLKPNQPAKPITAQQLAVVPKGNAPVVTPKPPGPVTATAPGQPVVQPTPTPPGKKGRLKPTPTPPVPAGQQPATAIAPSTTPPPAPPTPTPPGKKERLKPTPAPFVPPAQQPENTVVRPTPPPVTPKPRPTPNAALIEQQQQQQAAAAAARQKLLEQQQAAAAEHRQVQTPPPPPRPPTPVQPRPPGPVVPPRGKPTPTPTP